MTINPASINPFIPLTNRSINSQAAVLYEIRRKEQEHWYSGLRAAELFIDEKQTALLQLCVEQRKKLREMNRDQRRADELDIKPDLLFEEQDELEDLKDEIDLAKHLFQRLETDIRDGAMELQTAFQERDRILQEHPEILELNYQEIQAIYTPIAFQERQARYIAARMGNIPETVAEPLLSLPSDQRQIVLSRAVELQQELDEIEVPIDVLRLSPEQQQEYLRLAGIDQLSEQELSLEEQANG